MFLPQKPSLPSPFPANRLRSSAKNHGLNKSYKGFEAKGYFQAFAGAYITQKPGLSAAERAHLEQTAARAAMLVQLVQGLVSAGVVQPKDRLPLVKSQLRRLRKELEDEPVALEEAAPRHSLSLLRLLEADPVLPLVLR